MVAQDTGGAIVGPARADIYYGAGDEAGLISGRFKNPAKFVMLVPSELDPVLKQRDIPLPPPRPAATIASAPAQTRIASAEPPALAAIGTKPPRSHRRRRKAARPRNRRKRTGLSGARPRSPTPNGSHRPSGGRAQAGAHAHRDAPPQKAAAGKSASPLEWLKQKLGGHRKETGRAAQRHQVPIQTRHMSRRRLTDEERALWKTITRAIKPLRARPPDRQDAESVSSHPEPLVPRTSTAAQTSDAVRGRPAAALSGGRICCEPF
jgi:hypothetical protein